MLVEDDVPRRAPTMANPSLDRLGVTELERYIKDLRAEIARAEAEIARKADHRSAAESVFRT